MQLKTTYYIIPEADYIRDNGNRKKYLFAFVADDAFTLKTTMIKPYPGINLDKAKVIYNYRLSRARRVIENSFGILASRFRIFRRPIIANIQTVCNIVKATLALHNFLISDTSVDDTYVYCPQNYVDSETRQGIKAGHWRQEIGNVSGITRLDSGSRGSNNFSNQAKLVRDSFKDYFNSPQGVVSWQNDITTSTLNSFDSY